MTRLLHLSRFLLSSALALAGVLAVGVAQAEKADRFKKMEVESDQSGRVDLQNQRIVFSGNVVIAKGTLLIRAARVEVQEVSRGVHQATAFSAPGQPVYFRQKRDVLPAAARGAAAGSADEFIEGQAERLEYDSRTETVRFIDKAAVRRLRGSTVADEATGALIVYDGATEVFTVTGGAGASSPANPSGRVRVVLAPRDEPDAAAAPASGVKR